MRTPRLPAVDWTDAPADLNGLVRFAERRNLVSVRVPSHFKRSLRRSRLAQRRVFNSLLEGPASNLRALNIPPREQYFNQLYKMNDKSVINTCVTTNWIQEVQSCSLQWNEYISEILFYCRSLLVGDNLW